MPVAMRLGLGRRPRLQVPRHRLAVAALGDLGEELAEGDRGQDGIAGHFGEQGGQQRRRRLPRRRGFHDDPAGVRFVGVLEVDELEPGDHLVGGQHGIARVGG